MRVFVENNIGHLRGRVVDTQFVDFVMLQSFPYSIVLYLDESVLNLLKLYTCGEFNLEEFEFNFNWRTRKWEIVTSKVEGLKFQGFDLSLAQIFLYGSALSNSITNRVIAMTCTNSALN